MSSDLSHHNRSQYCLTRLKYRQGRELRAVKVYTVANESQYLLVFGVPKINIQQELKKRLLKFGKIDYVRPVTTDVAEKGMEIECFTEVFAVKFSQIAHARRCKRYMDAKEFYGGILHISYAPEYESVSELRQKLHLRIDEVKRRQAINAINPENCMENKKKNQKINYKLKTNL